MSYSRGRFGVEYHPQGGAETHRLRGLVCVVLALVAVTFISYKIAKARSSGGNEPPDPAGTENPGPGTEVRPPTPVVPTPATNTARHVGTRSSATNTPKRTKIADTTSRPPIILPPPQPSPTVAPEVRPLVARLEETCEQRPTQDQVLIKRYATAERQNKLDIASDAIRKLYDRPTMADLRDPLLRRLGDINLQSLFSTNPTPWTANVTVRRGDGRERIAHEYRNTPAVVAKLNPLVKWERLRPGNTVRVLRFPSAVLVIHKQSGCADLSLRKEEKFFRRYYLSTAKSAALAVYKITGETGGTVAARFRELGIRIASSDRTELEMFLAPGSCITVTE